MVFRKYRQDTKYNKYKYKPPLLWPGILEEGSRRKFEEKVRGESSQETFNEKISEKTLIIRVGGAYHDIIFQSLT